MKLISVLWTLGCLLLFSQSLFADFDSIEYKVKAGYIYNFTKFITWNLDGAETFNVCIVGDDPFGELIDPIEDRRVEPLPIRLIRYKSLEIINKGPHCHILFVSSSIKDTLKDWNIDNTLIVGEGEEFIKQGGMIPFVNRQGKIKLLCNLERIKQSGLKISAKLIEVCEVVKGDNNG
jgi:hypothetical protein